MQPKHLLCSQILKSKIPKSMYKLPKLGEYDGKGDLDKSMQLINKLNYYGVDEASKCKSLALMLVGSARLWINGLHYSCIKSWIGFHYRFTAYFTAQKRQPVTISSLSSIMQGSRESLWLYIYWLTQVSIEVGGTKEISNVGSSKMASYVINPSAWSWERKRGKILNRC